MINEPIFIRKTARRGYEIIGTFPGYGRIRKYARSQEEAKERFFAACNKAAEVGQTGRCSTR
ncbi:MAG TPA: hypothetical protein VMT71_11065 [Syntrophorhabdales bacterium]|nr:hypothetical protein [Syntrophorhabdales bacterium]